MEAVERQRNYLRNPLPVGEGICAVCRSSADARFELCYQCSQHRTASGGHLADVVAPISYSIKGTQHAHNLTVYKATRPSIPAQVNLSSLGIMYIAHHWDCFTRALAGRFTHVVTVPSTRGRQGPHPIEAVITVRIPLAVLRPVVNTTYSSDDRDFHQDRFYLTPGSVTGARILLIDDTWTSGGRVQSLAFALKAAGAVGVAAVVLGRHVNPAYGLSKPLVERLRAAPWFVLTECVLDTSGRISRR